MTSENLLIRDTHHDVPAQPRHPDLGPLGGPLALPPKRVIERTAQAGQGTGNAEWARIGFEALLRRLDREDPSYRR